MGRYVQQIGDYFIYRVGFRFLILNKYKSMDEFGIYVNSVEEAKNTISELKTNE